MAIKKRNRVKDRIGDLLGYGRCKCGKSFWYAGLAIVTTPSGDPRFIRSERKCDECYSKYNNAPYSGNDEFMKLLNFWDDFSSRLEKAAK